MSAIKEELLDEGVVDNANDTHFMPTAKPKTKRRNYVKKVEREWSHDEIMQLIVAVEERRLLWDIGAPEYKLPKSDAWKEVTNTIGDIRVDDAKAKWTNLRISFKNNLAKYRLKKSVQVSGEGAVIHWRYFKSLMFLEANNIQQSTESTSSLPLPLASTTTDAPPPPTGFEFGKRKRLANPGPSPMPSPNANVNAMRELAAFNALSSLRVHDDTFSAFGDYIASELRALPPERGAFVQRALNRELLRLLEAAETPASLPPQHSLISPVRIIDENDSNIDPSTVNPNPKDNFSTVR